MKRTQFRYVFTLGLILISIGSLLSQSLEENIYAEVDALVANPSEEKLTQLIPKISNWKQHIAAPNEHMALVILQSTMGYHHNRLNQIADAIINYEDAWQRFQKQQLQGYDIVEYCLKPLGILYIKTGAFSQAENSIKSYIILAQQQGNQEVEIAGIINLSVLYHNTGNYRTAIDILQQALLKQNILPQQKQKLENNLATNYIALEEYELAETLIKQALNSKKDINSLKNAAQIAVQNKQYTEAEKFLNEVKILYSTDTTATARDIAKFYVEKAQLFALQEKKQQAIDQYQLALHTLLPLKDHQQLPAKEVLYAENTFLDIFDGLALLSKDRSLQMSYLDLGIAVGKKLWQNLPDQQARIVHQSGQHLRFERMLDILYQGYEAEDKLEYIKEAFIASEASKAAVLTSTLSQQSLRARFPNDKDLQRASSLQQTQEALINQLNKQQRLGENTQQIIDDLNTAQLELESLQRSIAKRYPEENESVILTSELQQKLEQEQTQMIQYFFGKYHLYVFHLFGETISWKRIPVDATLRNQLQSFIGYFDQPNSINDDPILFSEVAFSLYKLLQLDMLTEEKKLQITPDGLLYFVPFDALQTAKNTAFEYAQMPFLSRKHQIGYQTSASIYLDSNPLREEAAILGMFPVFEGTNRSLTYSLEEANFVAESLPTTLFKKEEATKENFLNNANKHSILHISTHASGGDFRVPAHIEFNDQTLELPELYALSMSPQLVVLSACETGIGKVQKGEGAMSLARGFQYAGSKNILFTLWQVNDQTTARWMQLFYDDLALSGDPFFSQYKAKLNYLDDVEISNAKKSPYYWSAFTYYGATQPLFEPQAINWILILSVGIVIALMTLFAVRFLSRKKSST